MPEPPLFALQRDSFEWFVSEGLPRALVEVGSIEDERGRFSVSFGAHRFEEPVFTEDVCRGRALSYEARLFVRIFYSARLPGDGAREIVERETFAGMFPMMTTTGSFIINGSERVVMNQIVRSPGVYFTYETDRMSGNRLVTGKLIPDRGGWLEIESNAAGALFVRFDRSARLPVTTLLRVVGCEDLDEMGSVLGDAPNARRYLEATAEEDEATLADDTSDTAFFEIYRRLKPYNPPSAEKGRESFERLFFEPGAYSMSDVGRRRLDERLHGGIRPPQVVENTLCVADMVELVGGVIRLAEGIIEPDDIDALWNRRVRSVGELLYRETRAALAKTRRAMIEKMSVVSDEEKLRFNTLVNFDPFRATVRAFFATGQLCHYMDMINPLSETTQKRRITALGPGGLDRKRAGAEPRDVHISHFGRLCPIENPEGANIGLVSSQATYSRVNPDGFLETPYRKVSRRLGSHDERLLGRAVVGDVTDDDGFPIVSAGEVVGDAELAAMRRWDERLTFVQPFVSDEVEYLTAAEERSLSIAPYGVELDALGRFAEDMVDCRTEGGYKVVEACEIDYVDVGPIQMVSPGSGMIPFLQHDDSTRALMGANMQRQAVPLVRPEPPSVHTGMERVVGMNSPHVVVSPVDGVVESLTSAAFRGEGAGEFRELAIAGDDGTRRVVPLYSFRRSNQGTAMNQRVCVRVGQRVARGEPVVDGFATRKGEVALGKNLNVAFLCWDGYNNEDSIILSSRVVEGDGYTSDHMHTYVVDVCETPIGDEEVTTDLRWCRAERDLEHLDEEGVVRVGSRVVKGDLLVGMRSPRPVEEMDAADKLLYALGMLPEGKMWRDSSAACKSGKEGVVVSVRSESRGGLYAGELPGNVLRRIYVAVARRRPVEVGDKMSGRHGNKGIVSKILPVEDMPYMDDGTPIDILLTPLGIPSRMNLGQLFESHLGYAGAALGFRSRNRVFDSATDVEVFDALAQAWIAERSGANAPESGASGLFERAVARSWLAERGYEFDDVYASDAPDGLASRICIELWLSEILGFEVRGMTREQLDMLEARYSDGIDSVSPLLGKRHLWDGRTGERLRHAVMVGNVYMLKLNHLVDEKMHARSIGPYSAITRQPLGGKSAGGGQRIGEMEVWAMEGYGAAHLLQESLTIRSDDTVGREAAYMSMVNDGRAVVPARPESFRVLTSELRSLGLDMRLKNDGVSGIDMDVEGSKALDAAD